MVYREFAALLDDALGRSRHFNSYSISIPRDDVPLQVGVRGTARKQAKPARAKKSRRQPPEAR
jgi:hypothetical protein